MDGNYTVNIIYFILFYRTLREQRYGMPYGHMNDGI